MSDPAYLENFMRTENWIFDSPDQEGATLRQFVNDLYVDNKLVKGELVIGGKEVKMENIKCPLLVVCAKVRSSGAAFFHRADSGSGGK